MLEYIVIVYSTLDIQLCLKPRFLIASDGQNSILDFACKISLLCGVLLLPAVVIVSLKVQFCVITCSSIHIVAFYISFCLVSDWIQTFFTNLVFEFKNLKVQFWVITCSSIHIVIFYIISIKSVDLEFESWCWTLIFVSFWNLNYWKLNCMYWVSI